MHSKQSIALTPGQYQFRASTLLPWMNVKVFRESFTNQDELKVRVAGVEVSAEKLARHGQWKAI